MTWKLKTYLKLIEPWHVLVTLIVFIVGGIFAANAWVRKVSHDAVLEEKFLSTLAARVRPACIFDSRGAIEADFGAMEYLDDIRVIPAPQIYGFEIAIKAKRHLAYAPLVSGVNVNLYPQTVTRARMHGWSILMSPQSTTQNIIRQAPMDTNRTYRFKLETLHSTGH